METIPVQIDDNFYNIMVDRTQSGLEVKEVIWKRFKKDNSIELINITDIVMTFGGTLAMIKLKEECEF